MIEGFDRERLQRRQYFLESRARAHENAKIDHRWHRTAEATLLRDAAAVALLLDEFDRARVLLRKSGSQLLQLGFSGALQLLLIADAVDAPEGETAQQVDMFAHELFREFNPEVGRRVRERKFHEESFTPPQLLRTYQGLAGRRVGDTYEYENSLQKIREILSINASMPVGATRTPMSIYLAVFDHLTDRETGDENLPGGYSQIISSLAQRRSELLTIARRDRFHWKALLRPAELIDFDFLAMFVAGRRRGQNFEAVTSVFAERDPLTALPLKLAIALS
jgi:hypothetical protein